MERDGARGPPRRRAEAANRSPAYARTVSSMVQPGGPSGCRAADEQALGDEAVERVEVRARDRLGRRLPLRRRRTRRSARSTSSRRRRAGRGSSRSWPAASAGAQERPRAHAQQRERRVEALGDLGGGEQRAARRRELDRERQTVERDGRSPRRRRVSLIGAGMRDRGRERARRTGRRRRRAAERAERDSATSACRASGSRLVATAVSAGHPRPGRPMKGAAPRMCSRLSTTSRRCLALQEARRPPARASHPTERDDPQRGDDRRGDVLMARQRGERDEARAVREVRGRSSVRPRWPGASCPRRPGRSVSGAAPRRCAAGRRSRATFVVAADGAVGRGTAAGSRRRRAPRSGPAGSRRRARPPPPGRGAPGRSRSLRRCSPRSVRSTPPSSSPGDQLARGARHQQPGRRARRRRCALSRWTSYPDVVVVADLRLAGVHAHPHTEGRTLRASRTTRAPRWAPTAAAIASVARAKATKKASPSVWTSWPSCAANAARSSAMVLLEHVAVPVDVGRASSRVEPSMSVKRKVTVPRGSGRPEMSCGFLRSFCMDGRRRHDAELLGEERRELILRRLGAEGKVRASDLAAAPGRPLSLPGRWRSRSGCRRGRGNRRTSSRRGRRRARPGRPRARRRWRPGGR